MASDKRTYTIPLRREFRETERYNKTKRAVKGVRMFLQKHMKSEEVRIGRELNLKLWSRGGRNPPHKITVVAEKNADGVVFTDLEGVDLPTDIERQEAAAKAKEEEKSSKKADKKQDASEDAKTPAASEKTSSEAKKSPAKKAAKSTEE